MGCFDSVFIPCPKCGCLIEAQSKSGPCVCRYYTVSNCPPDVAENVNRHAPFTCECGVSFYAIVEKGMIKTKAYPTGLLSKTPIWAISIGFDRDLLFGYHHCWYDGQNHSLSLFGFYLVWEGWPWFDIIKTKKDAV